MKRSPLSPLFALLTVLMLSALPRTASAETVQHLLFDDIDKTWYCVGSPVNCDFSQT